MKALLTLGTALLASPALAHEVGVGHVHPHPDPLLAIGSVVVVIGLVWAIARVRR